MIALGKVPVMIIEPDAVWTENPLDDPAITDSEADMVGFTDGDEGVGGIVRIWLFAHEPNRSRH